MVAGVFIGVHAHYNFSEKKSAQQTDAHCSELLRIIIITLISSSFSSLNGLDANKESVQCNKCSTHSYIYYRKKKRVHALSITTKMHLNKSSSIVNSLLLFLHCILCLSINLIVDMCSIDMKWNLKEMQLIDIRLFCWKMKQRKAHSYKSISPTHSDCISTLQLSSFRTVETTTWWIFSLCVCMQSNWRKILEILEFCRHIKSKFEEKETITPTKTVTTTCDCVFLIQFFFVVVLVTWRNHTVLRCTAIPYCH